MKKEADVAKQKQTMSMFFIAKPVASSPISRETTAGPSGAGSLNGTHAVFADYLVVTPTKVEKDEISDYQRVFKPFVKRANVFVAPINSWSANSGSVSTSEWVKESATEESSGCSSKGIALLKPGIIANSQICYANASNVTNGNAQDSLGLVRVSRAAPSRRLCRRFGMRIKMPKILEESSTS